jgi:hypothetical protein
VIDFHIAIPAVNGSGEDARALEVPVPSRRVGVAVVTRLSERNRDSKHGPPGQHFDIAELDVTSR